MAMAGHVAKIYQVSIFSSRILKYFGLQNFGKNIPGLEDELK
jgi:hypothetical protein